MTGFRVLQVEHGSHAAALHAVRQQVFVQEQGVPAALERDALDPDCVHVLALDSADTPIGTGRMAPDGRIGRMAVLAAWRSRGVGEALLQGLVDAAAQRGLAEVHLHAQLPAREFYARQGFIPEGAHFEEAGIGHQQMRRTLAGSSTIDSLEAAIAATTAVIHRARRQLWIHSPLLDPGLLDAAPVQAALRRFVTQRHECLARVILHDAAAVQARSAPLLALAQRLPSALHLREVADPQDSSLSSACLINDTGDYYFRLTSTSVHGQAAFAQPARSQAMLLQLQRVWDRSRDCSELRNLSV